MSRADGKGKFDRNGIMTIQKFLTIFAGDHDDNDFDFEDNNSKPKGQKGNAKEEKMQKIENHHFDEAVELSDGGSGTLISTPNDF